MAKNGRITMAVLKNDVEHLKNEQTEMKGDVKKIIEVIQIVKSNKEAINRLWWLLGIITTAVIGGGSYVALN